MAEDNFQERTEKATPRRRSKARDRGQVARSMDLTAAIMICLGFTVLFALGPALVAGMGDVMRHTMSNAPMIALSDPTFVTVADGSIVGFLTLLAPIFLAMTVIGFGANVVQVGFKISSKAMEPKFDKLNVVNGFKRLFSMRSLVQLVRDPVKLAVVGLVGFLAISSEFESFFALPDLSVTQLGSRLGELIYMIAIKIGISILIIGLLDYFYQKYEFEKSIKMSRQEVKDEMKDTEGSPQVKQRTRQVQREMARRRMMSEVPTADVVITNPTHLAVALKYEQSRMDAPVVVAKGERLVAQKIKDVARQHGIPIIEDKPLARALFKMCDVGSLVPESLYRAVAEILAHIYKVKNKVTGQ